MKSNSIIFLALALVLVFAFLGGCANGNNYGGNTGPGNGGTNATITPEQKTQINSQINELSSAAGDLDDLTQASNGLQEVDLTGNFGG